MLFYVVDVRGTPVKSTVDVHVLLGSPVYNDSISPYTDAGMVK